MQNALYMSHTYSGIIGCISTKNRCKCKTAQTGILCSFTSTQLNYPCVGPVGFQYSLFLALADALCNLC